MTISTPLSGAYDLSRRSPRVLQAVLLMVCFALMLPGRLTAQAVERVGDLVTQTGSVPRRLIGYGLVIGLEGSGDRTFGYSNGDTPTVRSIANALRRFGLEVPPERLRPRNVAAVVVTAEASPYLRAGGRFEVQVSSIGDATSLRGGVLWTTPLMTDVDQPPVATAQGPLLVADDESRISSQRGNSARIPEGGVLEIDPPAPAAPAARLILRKPGLGNALRVVEAINVALGDTVAKVDDPGSISLKPPAKGADNLLSFLAMLDTIPVRMSPENRVVIDARSGTVVTGGAVRVAAATVSHRGFTLRIGGPPSAPPVRAAGDSSGRSRDSSATNGLLAVNDGATVQEVAAGLHAAGARPTEIAAMFSALREVGALSAELVVR
ncbi:MAG TPA: flagellar basal body P-ring protein FlgI [Gemmatimonadales bacterium]|nr:flagellar basal body P-ring protein FlgI [Gemmatimonadales bacterium]